MPLVSSRIKDSLVFPRPEPPDPGQYVEIADGILWLRISLPFRLNHINVYLIEDGGGWAVLDTGIDNVAARRFFARQGLSNTALRFSEVLGSTEGVR